MSNFDEREARKNEVMGAINDGTILQADSAALGKYNAWLSDPNMPQHFVSPANFVQVCETVRLQMCKGP